MKTQLLRSRVITATVCGSIVLLSLVSGQAAVKSPKSPGAEAADTDVSVAAESPQAEQDPFRELKLEPRREASNPAAWLGLGTEEASEALTSQLKLPPGVGLVVTYLASDGPAAKAGLEKNDLLVELENQQLVHPSQLRKLVQVRKEGDPVRIVYYRAGDKHDVTATLGKTSRLAILEDERGVGGAMKELQLQLRELPIREAVQEQMKALRESLGNLKFDQQKVQEEVKRSVEAARKALDQALRDAKKSTTDLAPTEKALRELEHAHKSADRSVTIRSKSKNVKSVVKSDDAGTIVIVSNPTPHLTVHDKDGKLVFDGPVATAEEQEKVPRDLWERVEPMLDQFKGDNRPEEDQK